MNPKNGLIAARPFIILMITVYLSAVPTAFPLAEKPPVSVQPQSNMESLPPSEPQEPKPLSLSDCYNLALKQSETIAIKREMIEQTEAEFFKAASELIGDADFLITDTRQDASDDPSVVGSSSSEVQRTFGTRHRRERKFVFTQPLFQGFKSIAALGAAGSFRKQRKEERVRAEQLLFLDVAKSFYDVLRNERDTDIVDDMINAIEERIRELTDREQIGRSRPSETATAVSRMKILEAELARSRGLLFISQHLLEFLIGISPEPEELKGEEIPATDILQISNYLQYAERRPDVEASKQAMKTAWRGVIEAQSSFWPELNLESNRFTKREGTQKDINWDAAITFTIPLSRGGENIGNFKDAVSTWKTAKWNYRLAKRKTLLEIKEAYRNFQSAWEQSQALDQAVEASQRNFDLQKEEYTRNLVSNLDVLEALEELYDTRRQANQAHYDAQINYWSFKVALGDIS